MDVTATHPSTVFDLSASLAAVGRQHAEGCVKISDDLARYRRIIALTRPTCVVELGTFSGKSALWFANAIGRGAQVVTVDVHDQVDDPTRVALDEWGVTRIAGSSTEENVVGLIHALVERHERVMVVADSDHSAEHVLAEMILYGSIVTPGCYMVVEDTIVRWMDQTAAPYDGSPLDAVERFMPTLSDLWEIDMAIMEAGPVTIHPWGWLRRRAPSWW